MAELKVNQKADYLKWVRVSSRDVVRMIATDEISYFKATDKYTLVVTGEGESLIKKTIKDSGQACPRDRGSANQGNLFVP